MESAPEGADDEDVSALTALAGWADDQLKEVGELYTHEEDTDTSPLADAASVRLWADQQFDAFVDALASEQSMEVCEEHRGKLAEAWRKSAADVARVYCMRSAFTAGSQFLHGFQFKDPAAEMCREIDNASSDIYEEWTFALGWKLARCIMNACTEDDKSEVEDEPVEESSEEEDGEEDGEEGEEESSSDSGESSSSEEQQVA